STPRAFFRLRGDVDHNFMKSSHARVRAGIFFPFLHVALTVGRANDASVIRRFVRHPSTAYFPQRPCQTAAGVIKLNVVPSFAVTATQLHARDAAAATL